MDTLDEILEHHGIKGMKWGVRRSRGGSTGRSGKSSKTGHEPASDAARARELHSRAKSSGTHTLSNQELQHLTQRMNLEQQYSRLTSTSSNKSTIKKGYTAIKAVLGVAKTVQEVHSVANSPMMKDLKKELSKKKSK